MSINVTVSEFRKGSTDTLDDDREFEVIPRIGEHVELGPRKLVYKVVAILHKIQRQTQLIVERDDDFKYL